MGEVRDGDAGALVHVSEAEASPQPLEQQPSSDPHIESFDDHDLSELTQEALAVVERARAKWDDEPRLPGSGETRSPGQASDPAWAGTGAGWV